MRLYRSILLCICMAIPLMSVQAEEEVDESFFVEASVSEVRNVIHEMKKKDFLRVPLFFLAPSLVKNNVYNGAVVYDRMSEGSTANIDVTAEEDGTDGLIKVQVIGIYRGQFTAIGHDLVSNIERTIRRKLRQ